MLLLLKKIFKTDSTYQLFIVFLVFGISGSLSVYVSKPLLELLNYEEFISNSVIQIILRILNNNQYRQLISNVYSDSKLIILEKEIKIFSNSFDYHNKIFLKV